MSLSRSFNKAVAKATYDPALEKQLAEEKAKAREVRGTFRETIDKSISTDAGLIRDGKLTPQGSTQSAALFKITTDWLAANPDATSDELNDKIQEFQDKLATIYREDANRIYFYNVLKALNVQLLQFKSRNILAEDKYKKAKEILDKEQVWLEKNPNESAQTYTDKLNKTTDEIKDIIGDPDISGKLDAAKGAVKDIDNTQELDAEVKKADEVNKQKEALEKQEFNSQRIFKKIGTGVFWAFWISLVLCLAVLGGALAANEAIARPPMYRILYFIYGCLFFPIVIGYFIYRNFTGHPPYFGAYLIPLYEYDPVTVTEDSFFQKLFSFPKSPILDQARATYQAAADAAQNSQLDFTKIAKEIAAGQ